MNEAQVSYRTGIDSDPDNDLTDLTDLTRLATIAWRRRLKERALSDGLELEAVRKGLRIRMGRYPAEIAEGAEVYWEGGKGTYIGAVLTTALVD